MNPITLDTRLSARLTLDPPAPGSRLGEPVRCGLPWPRGAVLDVGDLRMTGPDGAAGVPAMVKRARAILPVTTIASRNQDHDLNPGPRSSEPEKTH
jgi:hypothetical protein